MSQSTIPWLVRVSKQMAPRGLPGVNNSLVLTSIEGSCPWWRVDTAAFDGVMGVEEGGLWESVEREGDEASL